MKKTKIIVSLILIMSIATIGYCFSRDWDNADPIDHSKNSTWPAEIREVMTDEAERLTATFYGFASGETLVGVKNLPFNVQAGDPGATASQIKCYSKDVSSKAELFCQDEDGDVIQFTSGGSINVSAACESVYPVGHIYISTVSTNPGTLLGCGTWAAWGEGRVIVGLDSGDSDFNTSEETGGSKTHTLTIDEIPAHTHTYDAPTGGSTQSNGTSSNGSNKATGSTGGGSAHTIVQPYIVAYMWERTS